jgi:alpha-L-fucosidase
MSGREGVQLLVDIVAKGGNLLLNIAPTPQGEWQQGAYDLLEEYSAWMKVNQQAIYHTKVLAPYKEKNICITQGTKGETNFLYLADTNETTMPASIFIASHQPANHANVKLLGVSKKLSYVKEGNGFRVMIPENLRNNPPCKYVWVIQVSKLQSN